MKKIPLNKVDVVINYEKMPSGMDVYVVKKDNVNNTYVTLTSKFGSKIIEFIPDDGKKMIKVPTGVAHFLEHQMFNMEDGTDPMDVFSQTGCNSNAYTSCYQTSYLFSGVNEILNNINYLLEYVSSPYFTDASVAKEKGIIIEELKMHEDDPMHKLYTKILFNNFQKSPYRFPVIGTINDVNKTKVEDLMACYKTFYHPANMFLTVVGNVSADDVVEVVKNSNYNKNNLTSLRKNIIIKEYVEPNKVAIEYEKIDMDVEIPKVAISYKINVKHLSKLEKMKLEHYLSILYYLKFGESSLFLENIRSLKLVTEALEYNCFDGDSHFIYTIIGEARQYDELIEKISCEFENLMLDEEDFNRKIKMFISSYIYQTDSVRGISNKINDDIITNGVIIDNYYDFIHELNFYEMQQMLKKIGFNNKSVLVIDKKKG